jgi:hypothetical protein
MSPDIIFASRYEYRYDASPVNNTVVSCYESNGLKKVIHSLARLPECSNDDGNLKSGEKTMPNKQGTELYRRVYRRQLN